MIFRSDLEAELAAELEVVALLIDGVGAPAVEQDALVHPGDQLGLGQRRPAGGKRHVGHPLELHRFPGVGVGAARPSFSPRMWTIPGGLVADQDAFLDQVPLPGLDALVVPADLAQRTGLGPVGHEVDQLVAEGK